MKWMQTLMRGLLVVSALGLSTMAHAAVVNKFNGGVTGVTNLDVNGEAWNVRFSDAGCDTWFAGCDEASDFPVMDLGSGLALLRARAPGRGCGRAARQPPSRQF